MYFEPIDNMAFDVDEFIESLSFTKKLTKVVLDEDGFIHIYLEGTEFEGEMYYFVVCKATKCTIHVEYKIMSDWLVNVNCCHCSQNNKIWRLLKRRRLI